MTSIEGPLAADIAAKRARRRRVARACDRCHRNACRCSPGLDENTCSRCEEYGTVCTYDRPVKRRGPQKGRLERERASMMEAPAPPALGPLSVTPASPKSSTMLDVSPMGHISSWTYEEIIDSSVVEQLVDIFYRTSFAIRPYFHWPTYLAQVRQQLYKTDRSIYVVTMAVCAMAAGTLRDGASEATGVLQPIRNPGDVARKCYQASLAAIAPDKTHEHDHVQAMKAKAILVSVCMQGGDTRTALCHLGDYVTLSAMNGFHREVNWPTDLKETERQERRRLYWCMYQLDQYVSSTFGVVPHHRESQTTVLYPAEVSDDEHITDTDFRIEGVSFLRGWNFCSDLYRVIEHVTGSLRAQQISTPPEETLVTAFLGRSARLDTAEALRLIARVHESLPPEFKTIKAMTGNAQVDRFGFIAANILITTQNLKMLAAGVDNASVHVRCAIAGELLDELSTIPAAYFHASSTTTLHHLAGVGHLLGSVIQKPLSTWTYLQVRNILLVLSNFLAKMESGRAGANGLSTRLRSQIARIDQFMSQNARERQDPTLFSLGDDLLQGWQGPTPRTDQTHSPAQAFIAPVTAPRAPAVQPSFFAQTNDEPVFDLGLLSTGHDPSLADTLPEDFFNSWPFQYDQADALDFVGGLAMVDKL